MPFGHDYRRPSCRSNNPFRRQAAVRQSPQQDSEVFRRYIQTTTKILRQIQ